MKKEKEEIKKEKEETKTEAVSLKDEELEKVSGGLGSSRPPQYRPQGSR